MNKLIGAAVAAAVVAGGWAGTTAYIGSRIDSTYAATTADIEQKLPFLRFTDRSVERGLTSAVYRGKLSFHCPAVAAAHKASASARSAAAAAASAANRVAAADETPANSETPAKSETPANPETPAKSETPAVAEAPAAADAPAVAEAAAAVAASAPFEIGYEHRVRHGPVLGADGFGAATIDSRITLSGDVPDALRDYLASLPNDALHTRVGFDGAYQSTLKLPVADLRIDSVRVTWTANRMAMAGRVGSGAMTSSWELPALALFIGESAEASHIAVSGLRVAQRFDGPANGLWTRAGTQKITVDRVEANSAASHVDSSPRGQMTIDKIALEQATSLDGELISIKSGATVDGLTWAAATTDGAAAKPFKLARIEQRESFERLHAPTLERWTQQAISGLASMCGGGEPPAVDQWLAGLLQALAHGPTISLDKLAADYEGQRGQIAYRIAMPGVTPADLDGPIFALLNKIEVKADVDLPRAWVETLSGADLSENPGLMVASAMVDEFVEQGWISAQDQRLKTSLVLQKGNATANGKPIGPALGDTAAIKP